MILYSLRRTTSIDRNVSKSVPTKYGKLKRINLSYSLKTKLWNSEDIDVSILYKMSKNLQVELTSPEINLTEMGI